MLVVEQEGTAILTAVGYTVFYIHFNEILTFNLLPQVSIFSFLKSQGMALLTLVRLFHANRRHQKFSKYEIHTKTISAFSILISMYTKSISSSAELTYEDEEAASNSQQTALLGNEM